MDRDTHTYIYVTVDRVCTWVSHAGVRSYAEAYIEARASAFSVSQVSANVLRAGANR